MKVLQVITSMSIGGAEKLIAEMCPMYRDRGIEVDVLLFDGCETPLKTELIERGFNVYELAVNKSVYNPLYIFKIIPLLKRYDVIHTHNTACQFLVAIAKFLSGSKVKLVTSEHNTYNRRRDIPMFKYIDRFIYKQYGAIIAISEKTQKLLIEFTGRDRGVVLIPNGINIDKYMNAEPSNLKDLFNCVNPKVITMVAGFREQKDQNTLIRAISRLPQDCVLCLVGDGERRAVCEELASTSGVSDRVNFMGIRSDVPNILRASDIVVMSSHWEGLSLSNLEGMSVGKPFVASNVNGLSETTTGAGLLFTEGDDAELADIITRLTNDEVLYQSTANACLERAIEYDLKVSVDKYIGVYNSLC